MEYTKLGRTGLDVSRICLGCMSYGGGNQGNHAWSLGLSRKAMMMDAAGRGRSDHRPGCCLTSITPLSGRRGGCHLRYSGSLQ